MADFEDSLSPTWANMVEGQVNLTDAIEGTIEFTGDDGREYKLDDEVATLLVRPRGWHLAEKHVRVDGEPVAGAFVDAGLYLFRNAQRLLDKGSGPYFYLPKMESPPRGAAVGRGLRVRRGRARARPRARSRRRCSSRRCPAAFEMEEILYELRDALRAR